ncbi:GIY-YIG nuclease family protein [Pontibacter sp. E15-1]|uniref:GIY-YIG nuclease family protein n=1 Tax=Pontibacter sp. E15-1 TaxID=2919918 RepID=UPI001F4FB8F1|nr:GIY-YIG nuclease family protein [Pontibacter sp. E15-1]MCJ8165787.1 GIY-YIG nuclease family protein [Pontibacter sp. E15-1]
MSFYTYILFSEKLNRYYVGSCQDIAVRLEQHNTGRNTSTKGGSPWAIKLTETFDTRSAAQTREMEIKKKKSRKYIELLVRSAS